MDDTITTIYCLCDDFLKAWGHRHPSQARLSTAEVMTIPIVAAVFFGGNVERSRRFLREYGYVPATISKSRFNRRLHAIEPELWRGLFSRCWPEGSSGATPKEPTRWTPCRWPPATTYASAVAGFILWKSMQERFAATSRASGATFTACGCIWWSRKRASRWSSLWRRVRKRT